ncbi:IS1 family transposase [Microcoleus sp. FACHB-672]|uniref:IS1 family transposase n=1 Tax=Microcoleus sp. FACHB-672 TaxID=2692825 RepID=UPI00168922A3|nr:IS1 family transposase [Microcoleus sp. FACHB-672]
MSQSLKRFLTFVGNKRNNLWIWTAVNHKQAGILAWIIGDRSSETFKFFSSNADFLQCQAK